jgi:UDP-N-acetylmuramoyl-tripeptide--D-alanyl-D-alanine ligase
MSLWISQDASVATGGKNTLSWTATGVSIDTRTIQPGDLFVALKADRDGHEFLNSAFKNGAVAALVDHIPQNFDTSFPLLVVPDVMEAFLAMARFSRDRFRGKVIAITGSVGKTSTKEMLNTILKEQGKTQVSFASYNNHWGVPLTLNRMRRDSDFSVIEIGMNHPGEIAPLSVLANPHVALITSIAPAHLAAFESIEGIAREKASVAEGLKNNGKIIINDDNPTVEMLKSNIILNGFDPICYGSKDKRNRILNIDETKDSIEILSLIEGEEQRFKLNTIATHFANNALGALIVAKKLNCDIFKACESLEKWLPGVGRGSVKKINLSQIGLVELIDDGYNANPVSMLAALNTLGKKKAKRRIAILGDMKELGNSEIDYHKKIASLAVMSKLDCIHTVGPLMGYLHNILPEKKRGFHFKKSNDILPLLDRILKGGDCLLIKASLSIGMKKVSDAISNLECLE